MSERTGVFCLARAVPEERRVEQTHSVQLLSITATGQPQQDWQGVKQQEVLIAQTHFSPRFTKAKFTVRRMFPTRGEQAALEGSLGGMCNQKEQM